MATPSLTASRSKPRRHHHKSSSSNPWGYERSNLVSLSKYDEDNSITSWGEESKSISNDPSSSLNNRGTSGISTRMTAIVVGLLIGCGYLVWKNHHYVKKLQQFNNARVRVKNMSRNAKTKMSRN